jgi:hypothetical protein
VKEEIIMPSQPIEWVLIKKWKPEPIGAIGFIGNQAVAIIAFYDDYDANQDGNVGWGEWAIGKMSPVSIDGRNVAEVAMQARVEPDVILRDGSFPQMANSIFLNFARGLIIDGIYAAYFKRGVSMAGGGIAKMVTSGMVKEFAIKKGFETAVKEAFNAGVGR